METAERNDEIFNEHVCSGISFGELGERFEITGERARQIFQRAAGEHINSIEMNLLLARKEGNLLALAIPDAIESQQDRIIGYLHWVLIELSKRDLDIDVNYQPLPEGQIVFLLEDVTEYGGIE